VRGCGRPGSRVKSADVAVCTGDVVVVGKSEQSRSKHVSTAGRGGELAPTQGGMESMIRSEKLGMDARLHTGRGRRHLGGLRRQMDDPHLKATDRCTSFVA
jgi:hypothetical protein